MKYAKNFKLYEDSNSDKKAIELEIKDLKSDLALLLKTKSANLRSNINDIIKENKRITKELESDLNKYKK